MPITISFHGAGSRPPTERQACGSVAELLDDLGLSGQEYLVAVGGEMVSVDEPLADGDQVTLIRAITGG